MKKVLQYYWISFLIFFFVGVSLLYYHALFRSYFLQDEWSGFANYLENPGNRTVLGIFQTSFKPSQFISTSSIFTHNVPLTIFLSYVQFLYFKLNFTYYALSSILLHAFNSFLVFILFQKLQKNKWFSIIGALLFETFSIHYQAITWISTYTPTLGSFFFAALAC